MANVTENLQLTQLYVYSDGDIYFYPLLTIVFINNEALRHSQMNRYMKKKKKKKVLYSNREALDNNSYVLRPDMTTFPLSQLLTLDLTSAAIVFRKSFAVSSKTTGATFLFLRIERYCLL